MVSERWARAADRHREVFMSFSTTGPRSAILTVTRTSLAMVGLLLVAALGACTTSEGTNALVDPGTFEREVMTSTLQGLALVPQDQKPTGNERRAPLVLPRQAAMLPTPTKDSSALLPKDSNNVQINSAGISDADMQRLRNARVVDLHSLSGRPLTDIEQRQLTARMTAARLATSGQDSRALTLPPEEYFTLYKGKNLVCLAPNGQLVAISDPSCPDAIRKALQRSGPNSGGVDASISSDLNGMRKAGQSN